jgi:hypothetical protein
VPALTAKTIIFDNHGGFFPAAVTPCWNKILGEPASELGLQPALRLRDDADAPGG